MATDADMDGYVSDESGGDDCNDSDPMVHPNAHEAEEWEVDDLTPILPGSFGGIVGSTSLIMDGDVPRILCARGSWPAEPGAVLLGQEEGSWTTDDLGTEDPVFLTALSIDEDGKLHAAMAVGSVPTQLTYATSSASGWTTAQIVPNAYPLGIRVDESGWVSIAYQSDNSLALARGIEGVWDVEELGFTADCGGWRAATIDSRVAHFAWGNPCNGKYDEFSHPEYVTNSDGLWTSETITEDLWTGNSFAITLDAAGAAHVAIAAAADSSLGGTDYAWRSDAGWVVERVGPDPGPAIGVAVDAEGTVHVISSLHHNARDPSGTWTSEAYSDMEAQSVRVAVSAIALHVAFVTAQGEPFHARRSLVNGIDDDCDGIVR